MWLTAQGLNMLYKLILPLLLFYCVQSNAQNTDVLVMSDSQDFIDSVTNGTGEGTISSVYTLLYREIGLPQKFSLTPLKRQNRALEQSDYPACALYRFKSKARAAKYAFSKPIYFLLHYKLYQQADSPPLPGSVLTPNGEVSSLTAVHDLMKSATFLIIPTYSYGDVLDSQISALPESAILNWVGNVPHNRISNLFFNKRTTFALMFPGEVQFYLSSNPNAKYQSYPIAGVPYETKGYMMCNKHPASYEYINQVNKAMSTLYTTPQYLLAHTRPYPPEEAENIRKALVQFISE